MIPIFDARLLFRLTLCLSALVSLGGCATYEYDIMQPADLRRHISHANEETLTSNSLEYRMIAVEDHLVLRIFNKGAGAIHFIGDQSSVVAPSGQSHALRGMTLPPGAHMKLVLPPMARVVPTGPTIGIGFGMGFSHGYRGRHWGRGIGFYDPLWDEPRYIAVYDAGEEPWRWPADADARLVLTFQAGADKPFVQEWVIRKRKM